MSYQYFYDFNSSPHVRCLTSCAILWLSRIWTWWAYSGLYFI